MRPELKTLPDTQRRLLERLAADNPFEDFYLAGGTALALQLGHRQSVDFDFFAKTDFHPIDIALKLREMGAFEIWLEAKNTLHGRLENVRVSFLGYRYPMVARLRRVGALRLAGPRDIACMKLSAIAARGAKKDFIDLFFLLKSVPLTTMLSDYRKKDVIEGLDDYQLLKSMTYFADAEDDPMPKMFAETTWAEVKSGLVETAKETTKQLGLAR